MQFTRIPDQDELGRVKSVKLDSNNKSRSIIVQFDGSIKFIDKGI